MDTSKNCYPECSGCASCCSRVAVLCVSSEEQRHMRAFIAEHGITPIDHGENVCPLLGNDNRCMVYDVRPQPCRIHNCTQPFYRTAQLHPDVHIDETGPLLDMRAAFLQGDFSDPRRSA